MKISYDHQQLGDCRIFKSPTLLKDFNTNKLPFFLDKRIRGNGVNIRLHYNKCVIY